jgi:hypothetical protein
MRVRREFAAPFVITVGLACSRTEPAREILRFEDADCFARGDDGGIGVVSCPDAVLPTAPRGSLVRVERGDHEARCFVFPRDPAAEHEGRVRCPDGGPTVILPDPAGTAGGTGVEQFDAYTDTCMMRFDGNPPRWVQDRCPPELLPRLAGGLEPTREDGGHCFYGDVEVRCR